ncbi:MAG: hypothetical protein CMN28_05275 [Salinisphaeraceae bacterium]|jgi:predicted SAM-dependent methyltransferase|nr:hypothetical protein [Salinisphaeraceae bacterium]
MGRTARKIAWPVASRYARAKSRRKIGRLLKGGHPIWLEVGAGERGGNNGWTTLDLSLKADLFADLRKGLPFPPGSIDRIYSSHFLEHLTFRQGQDFLGDCLKALRPGGEFSICVPNARIYLEAYVRGQDLPDEFFGYQRAFHHTTRIDYVNYTAYMNGQHCYMFDEENLIRRLEIAGFKNPGLRAFDPELDRADRDYESIYAAANR